MGTPHPQVIACLIWWDERPDWLAACVASCATFCSHIVAVDGAYSLFPNATAVSPPEQAATIMQTAEAHGMGCTIHEPDHLWEGQEPEKRAFLFELAESVAVPNIDWYFKIDADEEVHLGCTASDLVQHLGATTLDVGKARFYPGHQTMRRLFRALPGLRATSDEEYATPDGRVFLANPETHHADELLPVEIDHRRHDRRTHKQQADKYVGYELARHYGFYPGVGPTHLPPGMVDGCLRERHPDGCGGEDCPHDFRRCETGHWRECAVAKLLERKVREMGPPMVATLDAKVWRPAPNVGD